MPLPPSGQISINQIRTELGTSSGSLRTLSSLAGFSTPDAMSEFYGYSAGSTIQYYYSPTSGPDIQYMNVYYNSSNHFLYSFTNLTTDTLSPASQSIEASLYHDNGGQCELYYYVNNVLINSWVANYSVSSGPILTSSGNTYKFIGYTITLYYY
jgi:hypothetical protein